MCVDSHDISNNRKFIYIYCAYTKNIGYKLIIKSFFGDDTESKNPHHHPHGPSKRASFTISNIMSNPRSLSASRNNSFCTRSTINHGAHARKIAQILLSPTGSYLPSNDCSTYMKHDASYDMVCVV